MAMMDYKDVKYTVELNIECIFEREAYTKEYHQHEDDDLPYLTDAAKSRIAQNIEEAISYDLRGKYKGCDLKIDVQVD
jgi:hypothetical protein